MSTCPTPWSEAPKWANWRAQDKWGRWFFFDNQPIPSPFGSWKISRTGYRRSGSADAGVSKPAANWEQTLSPRDAWEPTE